MMSERIANAEWALALRARELFHTGSEHLQERQAIDAALYALHALRTTTRGDSEKEKSRQSGVSITVNRGASMHDDDGQPQDEQSWRLLYEAAFFELDPNLLPQRIADAEKAMGERALALLHANEHNHSEKQALAHAHAALDNLLLRCFSQH
jgi:hypothetical protein